MAEQLKSAEDPTPIIVNAALDEGRSCDLGVDTVNIFVFIAVNLALQVSFTGGVYLGGIPHHILPARRDGHFVEVYARLDLHFELPFKKSYSVRLVCPSQGGASATH